MPQRRILLFGFFPSILVLAANANRWAVSIVEQDGDIRKSYSNNEGVIKMININSPTKGYALAVILGAIGGGLLVAIATKAIPKMMSGMMQNMMMQMGENGFNPGEM